MELTGSVRGERRFTEVRREYYRHASVSLAGAEVLHENRALLHFQISFTSNSCKILSILLKPVII